MNHYVGGLVFSAFQVAAAVSDLRFRRIPNALTASCASMGLTLLLLNQSHLSIRAVLVACSVTLAAGIAMQSLRLMGGGDVKLLTASAVWLGPDMLDAALWTALFGGVVALFYVRRAPRASSLSAVERWQLPTDATEDRAHVPYGVAIALACIVTWFAGRTLS